MSVLLSSFIASTNAGYSSNLFDVALITSTSKAVLQSAIISGPKTFNGLVSEPALSKGGLVIGGMNYTFYNRILIEPNKIDVGNMLSNQVRPILVWNGFFETKNLSSVTGVNNLGMVLTGGPTLPYNFRPLETLNYTLTVSSEGPANIDAQYTWRVDSIGYTADVVGKRTIVFAFPVNLDKELTETLEWKTEIIVSHDGSEQRRALRTKPRRSFEYYLSLAGFEQQLFQNSLLGWQNRVFALPVWTDKLLTTSAMAVSATTVPVNPSGYSFVVGESLILFKDAYTFEVAEILTVSTTIGLKNATSQAWPKGTQVFPLTQAHLPGQTPVVRYTDNVMSSDVDFVINPAQSDSFIPATSAPTSYDGLEIITVQPNWINNINVDFEYLFDVVDKQTGAISWFASQNFGSMLRSYSWLLKSRAEILAFRAYLGRMNGRQKTCWVPSWTEDFTVINNVGSSDTSITTKENGFRKLVGSTTSHDRIMVKLKNGNIYYRQITGVQLAADLVNTQLNLNTTFGVAFTPADVQAVHLINRCRLATDKVQLKWKSNSTVIVSTTFKTVKP